MQGHESNHRASRLKVTELVSSDEQNGAVFLSNSGNKLISSIVEAALEGFGAAAASIALVDVDQEFLLFTIAHGAGNEEVIGKKIPLDIGIAGYVIMSEDPLSIEDVHKDPRFHHSFAESTGYIPSSLLAAPLFWLDEIIGVMEILDKTTTFRSREGELDLLGLFAEMASAAIVQWQYFRLLSERTNEIYSLQASAEGSPREFDDDFTIPILREIGNFSESSDLSEGYQILKELSGQERQLGVEILRKIAEHFKDHRNLDT